MRARQQLAALHTMLNVDQQQASTQSGTMRRKLVFSKAKKQWVAKKIYAPSAKFVFALMQDVLDTKQELTQGTVPECIADFPPIPEAIPSNNNIASEPCPPKENVIAQHVSRMV